MVSLVEATVAHLQLAAAGPRPAAAVPDPIVVPALARNISL